MYHFSRPLIINDLGVIPFESGSFLFSLLSSSFLKLHDAKAFGIDSSQHMKYHTLVRPESAPFCRNNHHRAGFMNQDARHMDRP